MVEMLGAALLLGYLPGALLYRLPLWQRDRRAALDAPERVFWYVVLSVSWSLTLVLALAALDLYRFDRLLLITGTVVLVLVLAARGGLHYRTTAPRVNLWAMVPVLLVAVSVYQFLPVSEYIIGGRDPGVYVNEGIQIAQRGSLVIRDATVAAVPPFARDLFFPSEHRAEYYSASFMGFFIQDPATGRVVGQFPHMFPASIAIGYGLDGLTGARQTVAWWGVLGILGVYFVGARLFGKVAGLAAAGLLILHVAQVWFSRYPNADIVMQAGLFAALLAFARAHEDDDAFFGPVAAWILGLQLFSRADALLPMIVLSGTVVLQWAVTPGARLKWRFLAPLMLITGVGLFYQTGLMAAYFWRHLIFLDNLSPTAVAAGIIGGVGALVAARVWRETRTATVQAAVPAVLAVTLITLGVYAYFWREPGGRLIDIDAYALRDFVNLYLSPAMFALALGGLALSVRRDFWRHPAFYLTFAAFALFLLYKLRIWPEHFWQARRFLAIILPGAILIGCGFVFGHRPGSPRWFSAFRHACGILIVALVAPHYTKATGAISEHVEYRNVIPYVETLANAFGPRDLVIMESRDTGSDVHVLGTPLAYIHAKSVLVLNSAGPDRVIFREFLADALTRYERVLFVGTGGTTLLSRDVQATPIASDRVQVDQFESTTDRLPTSTTRKEFDYGIYQLTLGSSAAGPFVLDVGERDDLHLVRFHAKEQTEGRSIRWTQDASEIAITGLTAAARTIVISMSDGGRPAAATPARVEVYLNGTFLGVVSVAPLFREYPFVIPPALAEAAAQSADPAALRLVSTVWSPRALLGVDDGRELGVMLDTVTVR
jgi:hypothetical protein